MLVMRSERSAGMKFTVGASIIGTCLFLFTAGVALGANPHTASPTGQPSQSCQATNPSTPPGGAAAAPGSAFNTSGTAGMVYANQPQPQSNPNSVSQYDVACFQ